MSRVKLQQKIRREYVVLGLQNSGTTLCQRLLDRVGLLCTPVGKHAPDERALCQFIEANQGMTVVIMVRHPASWVASMKRQPYEWELGERIHDSCAHKFNGKLYRFENMMTAYETYMKMYEELARVYKNVRFLEYEKVIDPENGYNYFNATIPISRHDFRDVLGAPSKRGLCVNNSQEAYKKAKNPFTGLDEDESEFIKKKRR